MEFIRNRNLEDVQKKTERRKGNAMPNKLTFKEKAKTKYKRWEER